jgi:hypothetical protein
MRGIGKGQTIMLFVTPEVLDLIRKHVSIGSSGRPYSSGVGDLGNTNRFLKDVISWLVINSMRVDSVQYNLLCEQSVANIWRKRCFSVLLKLFQDLDSADRCPPQACRSLQVFRERIDFEIENSIPKAVKYSEKIRNLIESHGWVFVAVGLFHSTHFSFRDLLAVEMDRKTADFILSLIQEEEVKSDQLKKQYLKSQVSDLLESSETAAAEQSFNREQVQEQEQVCFCYFYNFALVKV